MEYIRVTKENIESEHICCAISNNKDIQVSSKKAWLSERFDDGLVFLKSTERGKCFIEYIPAENAWNPLVAKGYMYIDCLWVSGSFKGHGYSNDLLNACIEDSKAKGKKGLCILSSAKKKPFLADPKFLKYKGFSVCDEADNGVQLWYLPFTDDTNPPRFRELRQAPAHRRAGLRPLLHEPVSVQCEVCSHSRANCKRARRAVQSCPHRKKGRRAERAYSHNHLRSVLQRRIPDQRTDERQEIHQAH